MADEHVETPEVETPAVTEETPKPTQRERLEAVYEKEVASQAGAVEPAPTEQPAAEGAEETPNPDGSEKPAEETPVKESEKLALKPEQLADSKYWGALDADGWKRMERDYPVETKLVKSAQAAAAKIVNGARKEAPTSPKEERHEVPPDETPSAELSDEELAAKLGSLDPADLLDAVTKIADARAMKLLRDSGIDPARVKATAALQDAVNAAIEEYEPLGQFKLTELDAVAEENPALKKLAESGDPESIKIALIEAGRILDGRKKAATAKAAADKAETDRKKKETQKVVQSNATLASAAVLTPHGGKPDTRTQRERLNDAADREIARQNAVSH